MNALHVLELLDDEVDLMHFNLGDHSDFLFPFAVNLFRIQKFLIKHGIGDLLLQDKLLLSFLASGGDLVFEALFELVKAVNGSLAKVEHRERGLEFWRKLPCLPCNRALF